MRALVSACLLGMRCRYDGGSKPCPAVLALADRCALIPVCPEQLGGLPADCIEDIWEADRRAREVAGS